MFVLCSHHHAETHALRDHRHWAEDWPPVGRGNARRRLRRWVTVVGGLFLGMAAGLAALLEWDARRPPPETTYVHFTVANRTGFDLVADNLVIGGYAERVRGVDPDEGVIAAGPFRSTEIVRVHAAWAQATRWSLRLRNESDATPIEVGSLIEPKGGWTCEVLVTVHQDRAEVVGCLHSEAFDDSHYAPRPRRPRGPPAQH